MTACRDTYTFGDTSAAAHRLALLADVYEPSTRAFLSRWCPAEVGHAVDLGCGPGHTTRLLHDLTGATRTTGVERSPEYVAAARSDPRPGVRFVLHDVTADLPVDPADVVHARFLLTHLADPAAAVRRWAPAVRPGGRMLLQEVARLVSRDPALGRYYELVAELQAHHGQSLDVGARLPEVAAGCGLEAVHFAVRPLTPPVDAMAALHVLNLRTWRQGPFARGTLDADELDALDAALVEIAHGRAIPEPIEQDLAQLVLAAPGCGQDRDAAMTSA